MARHHGLYTASRRHFVPPGDISVKMCPFQLVIFAGR